MLGDHQHKWEIIHAESRIKQPIRIHKEDYILYGIFNNIGMRIWRKSQRKFGPFRFFFFLPRRRRRRARPASWSGGVLTTCAVRIELTYFVKSRFSSSSRKVSQSVVMVSGERSPRLPFRIDYRNTPRYTVTYPIKVRNKFKWSTSGIWSMNEQMFCFSFSGSWSTITLRSMRCLRQAKKALR